MNVLQTKDYFHSDEHAIGLFIMMNQPVENVHAHEFDELVIVFNGGGFHICNDKVSFINKGDCFFVSATDVHNYESTNNLSIINLLIKKERNFKYLQNIDVLLKEVKVATQGSNADINTLNDEALRYILHCVDSILMQQENDYDEKHFSQIECAFFSIINTIIHAKVQSKQSEQKYVKIIRQFCDNYYQGVNVRLISKMNGIGQRTLYRVIKEITGLTPERFLQRIRLLKAREMIRTTDKSINKIAFDCGFSNATRLSEAYKQHFSRAPSDEYYIIESNPVR
ncbi:TPA: helix-turn-helix domain-containing protein [Klebsiella pneumoniae]|nr:helix-turn-helix domain-containing protein [Klebsiella pneumoniae]